MSHHAPGYWMNEQSGVLDPVVRRYIAGDELRPLEVAAMRAYLRQWIDAPGFIGPAVDDLRRRVEHLATTAQVRDWLDDALDAGIDPL